MFNKHKTELAKSQLINTILQQQPESEIGLGVKNKQMEKIQLLTEFVDVGNDFKNLDDFRWRARIFKQVLDDNLGDNDMKYLTTK